jgi:hypothetical protein
MSTSAISRSPSVVSEARAAAACAKPLTPAQKKIISDVLISYGVNISPSFSVNSSSVGPMAKYDIQEGKEQISIAFPKAALLSLGFASLRTCIRLKL